MQRDRDGWGYETQFFVFNPRIMRLQTFGMRVVISPSIPMTGMANWSQHSVLFISIGNLSSSVDPSSSVRFGTWGVYPVLKLVTFSRQVVWNLPRTSSWYSWYSGSSGCTLTPWCLQDIHQSCHVANLLSCLKPFSFCFKLRPPVIYQKIDGHSTHLAIFFLPASSRAYFLWPTIALIESGGKNLISLVLFLW